MFFSGIKNRIRNLELLLQIEKIVMAFESGNDFNRVEEGDVFLKENVKFTIDMKNNNKGKLEIKGKL